ncbi:putative cancer-related nucleoside-triphosphatase [Trypoxylus dichotomus]
MSLKHITLTGLPGVGKTTLIKKLSLQLKENNIATNGFYTEEIRNENGNRIGFDIVTLDGKRGKLARSLSETPPQQQTKFRVGQYVVFPTEFENLVLPLFKKETKVMIIDEIGKMESFSQEFKRTVLPYYKKNDLLILATIPLKKTQIPFIEEIRRDPNTKLFIVDKNTRNNIDKDILNDIVSVLKI